MHNYVVCCNCSVNFKRNPFDVVLVIGTRGRQSSSVFLLGETYAVVAGLREPQSGCSWNGLLYINTVHLVCLPMLRRICIIGTIKPLVCHCSPCFLDRSMQCCHWNVNNRNKVMLHCMMESNK